jgi:NADH-quinone oxidoreductase subunit F
MMPDTIAVLPSAVRAGYRRILENVGKRVVVCAGTGCVANGSLDVVKAITDACARVNAPASVGLSFEDEEAKTPLLLSKSGCQGFCQRGPLVTIQPDGILYTKVKAEDADEIVERTILRGEVIERLLYREQPTSTPCRGMADIPFYALQQRKVLAACGSIDPENIQEYIALGGYACAQKAITRMEPEAICRLMQESGLRGRGGGGFPTGIKWELTRKAEGSPKYLICNGDEGDPGAFMDRSVMEGNPHSIIEGMLIGARAVGATIGYVYVRLEYPLAVARMKRAVDDARKIGLLGEKIFGAGLNFDITIMEGAGAFVCGEETALISSIEGKRGMPEPKPPYPAQQGLFGCPTVINNVETFSSVPLIMREGVEAFKSVGTEKSPGTKTFALTGHVVNTGLIEVPFGTTLRQIIFAIGGGVTGKDGLYDPDGFKAVQVGGPSGACLTHQHLDLPLDFDSLRSIDAMIGSGGLVVMNTSTCLVGIARYFMQFAQNESCGKCVTCREGTRQMLVLLDDIVEGRADEGTIELLETTARVVAVASLCGLGKSAPHPVQSTLRHFAEEYRAHIVDKQCPAGECTALCRPVIAAEKCVGCGLCVKNCPVGAITGSRKSAHVIDAAKCINCRACVSSCKLAAIS